MRPVGSAVGADDQAVRHGDAGAAAVRAARPGRKVGIYACGPTVYSRVHVGNARPFVVFSQLKRFLEHEGYGATLVANITDINDKIYDAARAAGRASAELAREMAAHYIADTERLGLGRPDHEPLASEYVEPIVDLIGALVERGHAYAAGGDVYFRVRTLPEYGALSRRDVDQMDQGEGVEGADLKEDPLDFALWKAHKEGEDTSWDSPWGRGRPGWHIECSAMAEALLGLEFDIHGGGIDLVFPHHENEVAQTLAGRGKPLARLWMHNGMLEATEGEKMAKSVGNIRGLGRGARRGRRRDAGPVLLRRPLPAAARLHARVAGGGGQRGAADPRGGAAAEPRASRRTSSRRTATRSSTRWPTTSTPRGRCRRCTSGSARRTSCPRARGDGHLREMLGVLGLESLLAEDEGAAARGGRAGRAARARRARRRTGPRPTACATSCATWAGRCATARRDRSSSGRPERRGRRPPKREDRARRDDRGRRARSWPAAAR